MVNLKQDLMGIFFPLELISIFPSDKYFIWSEVEDYNLYFSVTHAYMKMMKYCASRSIETHYVDYLFEKVAIAICNNHVITCAAGLTKFNGDPHAFIPSFHALHRAAPSSYI